MTNVVGYSKSCLGANHKRFGCAAFLHNATLCKKALGEKFAHFVFICFFIGVRRCRGKVWYGPRSVDVFVSKTMIVIFFERWEGVVIGNLKRLLYH
jgi:hypothetical protein